MPGPQKVNHADIPFVSLNGSQLLFLANSSTGLGGKNTLNGLIAFLEEHLGIASTEELDVSAATIILDMESRSKVYFFGTSPVDGNRTIEMDNDAESVEFMARIATDDTYEFTCPDSWRMPVDSGDWVLATKKWIPAEAGTYDLKGIYDGAIWCVTVTRFE